MRPHLQLFLHIAGAVALFGGTATVATLAFAARRRTEQVLLARGALGATLFVAVPGWVLMLIFGAWTKSKEGLPELNWIHYGTAIADLGIVFLLAAAGLSYRWFRRPAPWAPTVVGVLASAYLVALGLAWWVMSAKVTP